MSKLSGVPRLPPGFRLEPSHDWEDRILERVPVHRADVLVADNAVAVEHEGLGNAVNAPVDCREAFEIVGDLGVGITQVAQPLQGVVEPVLVVLAVYRDFTRVLQFHEQGMFQAAGRTPAGEHVVQRDPACERFLGKAFFGVV